MLEPAKTLSEEPAAPSVEEGVQGKPVRKRASKKPRTGLAKGMRILIKPTPEQAVKLAQWGRRLPVAVELGTSQAAAPLC